MLKEIIKVCNMNSYPHPRITTEQLTKTTNESLETNRRIADSIILPQASGAWPINEPF